MKVDTMSNQEIKNAVANCSGLQRYMEVWWKRDPETHKADPIDFLPDWVENLQDAWKLVLEAEKQDVGFSLSNIKCISDGYISYEAVFYDPWGGPMHTKYRVEAETAPRAICLAYLKWKGEEK